MPSVGSNAVKEAGTVKAAKAAQQTQGGGAFVLTREDGLQVQHQIELRSTEVGKDVTVVVWGHFDLLTVAIQYLDLALAAARASAAEAREMFVGIDAQEQQTLDLAAFEGLGSDERRVGP